MRFYSLSLSCLFWTLVCGVWWTQFPTSLVQALDTTTQPIHIGIIGSGIAGSSAAFWLKEKLHTHKDVHLTVFERSNTVGGRLASVTVDDVTVEAGGSIVHDSNEYMKGFARLLNLTMETPKRLEPSLGIWNSKEFAIHLHGAKVGDAYSMLVRYGLHLLTLKTEIEKIKNKFSNFYQIQASNFSFATPEDLLHSVDLYNLTQTTFDAKMQGLVSPRILSELSAACTRVNYGQSPYTINALAGAVGLIPLTSPKLFAIKEGNVEVVKGLLKLSQATVKLSTNVIAIEQEASSKLTIHSQQKDGKTQKQTFDYVIIATPLEDAHIQFIPSNTGKSESASTSLSSTKRQLQVTHTTFLKGWLRPENFPLVSERRKSTWLWSISRLLCPLFSWFCPPDRLPSTILTTEEPSLDFTSISAYAESVDPNDPHIRRRVYKVFSRQPFTDQLIEKYFTHVQQPFTQRFPWKAYPTFTVPETFDSFILKPRLYYINAFENTASCLEVECIASRNVVQLIQDDIRDSSTSIPSQDSVISEQKSTETPSHQDL